MPTVSPAVANTNTNRQGTLKSIHVPSASMLSAARKRFFGDDSDRKSEDKIVSKKREVVEETVSPIVEEVETQPKSVPKPLKHGERGRPRKYDHKDVKVICNICGRELVNKYVLEDHRRRHYDDKLFSCDVCSKKFNTNSDVIVSCYRYFLINAFNLNLLCFLLVEPHEETAYLKRNLSTSIH